VECKEAIKRRAEKERGPRDKEYEAEVEAGLSHGRACVGKAYRAFDSRESVRETKHGVD
jgi:hypothetical protein